MLTFVGTRDRYSPSGPCTPGLGILLLLLTLALAAIGLLVSAIARLLGKHAFSGPAIVNGAVLLGLVILIKSGGF